ncbi:hypothetical protein CKO50_21975 [Pseudoalteromonas sp. HM-SA03]|nr:hypothetical protein CKO50_21975 [Pseudoalteromonas sp. HM-SA03]
MSITKQKFCYSVVLNEKFLTQLASDLLLQIEQVLRLIGITTRGVQCNYHAVSSTLLPAFL